MRQILLFLNFCDKLYQKSHSAGIFILQAEGGGRMEQSFFELENPASAERPFLDLTRANISYDSHFHREIEVLYVICGRVRLVVNGKEYLLREHDIFIVMPGEIHSFSSGEENRLYVMKF